MVHFLSHIVPDIATLEKVGPWERNRRLFQGILIIGAATGKVDRSGENLVRAVRSRDRSPIVEHPGLGPGAAELLRLRPGRSAAPPRLRHHPPQGGRRRWLSAADKEYDCYIGLDWNYPASYEYFHQSQEEGFTNTEAWEFLKRGLMMSLLNSSYSLFIKYYILLL